MLMFSRYFLLITGIFAYSQTDYTVSTEHAEISSYNKKYVTPKVSFFKFNRTYAAMNFSMEYKQDFGTSLRMKVEAFKFASNEYREFPLIFEVNVCDILKKDTYGAQNIYNCGKSPSCPMKKGNYTICNWGPDYSKFPPYIPIGQYKVSVKFSYLSEEVYTLAWYMKVVSTSPLA